MQCPRCHFENMPGLTRCFKCNSVLISEAVDVDVNPPRMSAAAKPFRKIRKMLRAMKLYPEDKFLLGLPWWTVQLAEDTSLAFILSVIPGLAQLFQNRFKEIFWYEIAWAVSALLALFFFGSSFGGIMLGLTVGLHAWIAVNSIFEKKSGGLKKVGVLMVTTLLYFIFIYNMLTPFIINRVVRYGYSALDFPTKNISNGDLLLFPNGIEKESLKRGDILLVPTYKVRNGTTVKSTNRKNVGQLIAIPGEEVEIKDGHFFVDGTKLSKEQYPLPKWMKKYHGKLKLNQQYFISSYYKLSGHGYDNANLGQSIWNVCLFKPEEVLGKAAMIWNPVLKRSFIKD